MISSIMGHLVRCDRPTYNHIIGQALLPLGASDGGWGGKEAAL